jgi:hypothetical protein
MPPPELSRGGQEVWVLAGEKYEPGKAFALRQSLTSKKPESFFHLGDVFAWKGSRYSKFNHPPKLSSLAGVKKKNSPRAFEMREEVILSFHQQKKFPLQALQASLSQIDSFANPTSQLPQKGQPNQVQQTKKPPFKERFVGDLIRNGNELQYTAQIIRKKQQKNKRQKITAYVLRRVQPHLFSGGGFPLSQDQNMGAFLESFESKANHSKFQLKVLNLRPIGSVVQERDMVFQLSFPVEQSKTGDIVQGLPKIEQLFEGRGGSLFDETSDQHGEKCARFPLLSNQDELSPDEHARQNKQNQTETSLHDPARKRFILQRRLVDEIQSVYQSQGVEIADKHVEIIVRQMTSKVKILEKASTPFFPDDIIDFESLRRINPEHTAYEPIIMGITKVAFFTESFISAASFQETKRVLLQSAIQTRVDFLTGLKENVIVGRFIPAGTGQPVRPL